MKQYERLLRGGGRRRAERASRDERQGEGRERVPGQVGPAARRHPLPLPAAYHDACHLAHAQRITRQPRELLQAIPGLKLVEMPTATCCGSAGVYNLLQPQAPSESATARPRRCWPPGARC